MVFLDRIIISSSGSDGAYGLAHSGQSQTTQQVQDGKVASIIAQAGHVEQRIKIKGSK